MAALLGSGDPDFASVRLLLPLNGANGGTAFPDASSNAFTATRGGDAQTSATQSKWGGSSLLLDGASDYLFFPVGSAPSGTGNFTIEGWYRWSSITNAGLFHCLSTVPEGTVAGLALGYTGSTFGIYSGGANTFRAFTPATGVWYFIQLRRVSGQISLWVDGTQIGATIADAINYSGYGVTLGVYYSTGFTFNGNVQDFRVTNGVARSTTQPTAAFPTY